MQPGTLVLETRSLWGVWEGAMRREEWERNDAVGLGVQIESLVNNCGILNCLALPLKCRFPLL